MHSAYPMIFSSKKARKLPKSCLFVRTAAVERNEKERRTEMRRRKEPVCDRDCFHCRFPDCINDGMEAEDYVQSKELDRELTQTQKQKKRVAYQRAYYKANREKLAVQKRAYRKANRGKLTAYQRAYRKAKREKRESA